MFFAAGGAGFSLFAGEEERRKERREERRAVLGLLAAVAVLRQAPLPATGKGDGEEGRRRREKRREERAKGEARGRESPPAIGGFRRKEWSRRRRV